MATAAIGGDGVAGPVRTERRLRAGTEDPVNRAIRRVGLRAHRGDPRARRPAHVPPGDRRQQPRQRPEQHPQVPARREPSARRDPHRRRPDRGAVTPDRRRAEVPARVPTGRAVQRRSAGTSRSSSATPASKPATTACSPGATGSSTSARSSPARTTPATSSSRRRLAAQQTARDALGGQKGSVVALDIRTGEVLAMYSNPSFDPNPLAGHDTEKVNTSYFLLNADPAKPSLPRAYRERYPPGSTFKVVTAGGAIDDRQGPAGPHLSLRVDVPAPGDDHRDRQLRRVGVRRRDAHRELHHVVQRDLRAARLRDGRRLRARHERVRGRFRRRADRAAARPRSRCRREHRTGRRCARHRGSRSPASARATCSPRRSRWRWSRPASRTAA